MNATSFDDSASFILEGDRPRISHVKLSALFSSCVRVIDMIRQTTGNGKPCGLTSLGTLTMIRQCPE